jgi:hypothetical protein
MPRQPFLSVYTSGPPITARFGADAIAGHKLCERIAVAINSWTTVDAGVCTFLAAAMGTQARIVTSIYGELITNGPHGTVLGVVAKERLSAFDYKLFRAIKSVHNGRVNDRNYIVHGMWGVCLELPDSLVWQRLRAHLESEASHELEQTPWEKEPDGRQSRLKHAGELEDLLGEWYVYTESTFEEIIRDFNALSSYWFRFARSIRADQGEGDAIRAALIAAPPIRQELDKPDRVR